MTDLAAREAQAIAKCLQAIADLPTGRTEEVIEGHEDAYRAIERLSSEPSGDTQMSESRLVSDFGSEQIAESANCSAPPCPTCGQYSFTLGTDRLAEAFMHFQSMFSHRGDGIPTQYSFDARTRDAAQVLMAAAMASQSAHREGVKAGLELAAKEAEAWFPGGSANVERYPAYGVVAAIRALPTEAQG